MATLVEQNLVLPPSIEELLEKVPKQISEFELKQFDDGVFDQEFITEIAAPIAEENKSDEPATSDVQIEEGTWDGTQLALTSFYSKVELSYTTYFSALGVEPILPQVVTLDEKASRYRWSDPNSPYPPHLKSIPSKDQVGQTEIFSILGIAQAATLLPKIVPSKTIFGNIKNTILQNTNRLVHGRPEEGFSIDDVEMANATRKKPGTDIMHGQNIGLLPDWWSDARFAQQQFTGTNPTTIKLASKNWIKNFAEAAKDQKRKDAADTILSAGAQSLYIQDCSYFRDAIKAKPEQTMVSEDATGARYACAAVSLFQLHQDGTLHPLAIVTDYKGSMKASVVIFNKRLQPSNPLYPTEPSQEEKQDWPWRYAKTCAQVSDWIRHELTIHLVNTHLVEEVIIVAANRAFPDTDPIYCLLSPHWIKTLSLNAAARDTLVPKIIFDVLGFNDKQAYSFINHAFDNFDFVGNYIPNDLRNRGFPPEELDSPKFRNYPYARNMTKMWKVIHTFVASMIAIDYKSDQAVQDNDRIAAWYTEVRKSGRMPSFPIIKTVDQLVDAITMCIHIAAPQHTAVNYLQNFYQAFVVAKPPALCSEPPMDIQTLLAFKESDFTKTLHINRQREWLLSSHVPWLLSFRVADERNLINYANSMWSVYQKKKGKNEEIVRWNAKKLYDDLRDLVKTFHKTGGADMTPGTIPYTVMDPHSTAVSILI